MADPHLMQWVVAFAGALWWTSRWLLQRPESRWRHIVGGLVATLLWLPVAYLATNVHVADGGTRVAFGSTALAGFAAFAAVACVGGLVLGLFLWVEEAADDASDELPAEMRRGARGDD